MIANPQPHKTSQTTEQSIVHLLINDTAERLQRVGIDAGNAEAEMTLCYLLDCERLELYLHGAERITQEIKDRFEEIITRRETRYPLQYILGEAYFYGRRFEVNEAVMVPTPETELLCENAVRYLNHRELKGPRVLDVGCGSGVISITVKLEYPGAEITALDISRSALNVAKENAEALGASGIKFLQSNLYEALATDLKFDLILSNPPYIAEHEYEGLSLEVKADPKISLTSGDQGLDMIKKLIAEAPDYLVGGGKLMFEIGYNQAALIEKLALDDARYKSSVLMRDLNDIDRVVILSR